MAVLLHDVWLLFIGGVGNEKKKWMLYALPFERGEKKWGRERERKFVVRKTQ